MRRFEFRAKEWYRRIFCRWTRKGRGTRALAREFGAEEWQVFRLMLEIEAESLSVARRVLADWKKQRDEAAAAQEAARRRRPENFGTSGARLAQ